MTTLALLILCFNGVAANFVPISSLPWRRLLPRQESCPDIGRLEAPLLRMTVDGDGEYTSVRNVACAFPKDFRHSPVVLRGITFAKCYNKAQNERFMAFEFTAKISRRPGSRCVLYYKRPTHVVDLQNDRAPKKRCYVKDFQRFNLLNPPHLSLGSGYCRTTKGSDPHGTFKGPFYNGSMIECESKALRDPDVLGFEYDENLLRCELHVEEPISIEAGHGVWCFAKKMFPASSGTSIPNIPFQLFKPTSLELCKSSLESGPVPVATTNGTVSAAHLKGFYGNAPLIGSNRDIRGYPYGVCRGNDFCFETDADLLKFDCVCQDILPDVTKSGSLEKALIRYFDTAAYKKCFALYLQLVGKLFPIETTETATFLQGILAGQTFHGVNWRAELATACEYLRDSTIGSGSAFDIDRCVEVTAQIILLRDVEAYMACYSAALQCETSQGSVDTASVAASGTSCDGGKSVQRPLPPRR
eukprot:CAMPEP_0198328362 /NCGR_PEP_ID=MMETSP1450-20131203/15427_1 /TAXON_ID=753684 ORGANISM="Madagascaria erythrocladiodes, Strain CCMP3234" /NCGR_SAMPLE_ID=MMETSP1450 /ASSEMBLY_ACC=CAM_ASM_001115 /LENGTH=471 /DNA_ID=CAMNT_0044032495 /DNA_START=191 /DNA_END=1606 /DNA_ORIENTATION=+